jgi:hypothetical protein
MTDHSRSPDSNSVGAPAGNVLPTDKVSFTKVLATSVQSHPIGISLGIVGLVVGTLTASPLIVLAGLIGGITAGKFVDRNTMTTDARWRDSETTSGGRCPATDTTPASSAATAPGVADANCSPGFREVEIPVAPGPVGLAKPPTRRVR